MNETVRVSTLVFPPDVNACILRHGIHCSSPGYEIELFQVAAAALPWLRLDIVPVPDGNFGSIVNGTWNGLVGHVLYGDAEFSLKLLTYTEGRGSVVDFSDPVKYTKRGFLVKKGAPHFVSSMVAQYAILYMLPLIASVMFGYITLGVADQWLSGQWKGHRIQKILDVIQQSLACFVLKNYTLIPHFVSVRPYYVAGHFAFVTISAILFGVLFGSYLPSVKYPFEDVGTLADYIAKGEYRLISDSLSTSFFADVKTSSHPHFVKMRQALEANPPVLVQQSRVLRRIAADPRLVYVHVVDVLRKFVNSRCDQFLIIQDATPIAIFSGFIFKKGSKFRGLISAALRNTVELTEVTLKKRYFPYQACDTVAEEPTEIRYIFVLIAEVLGAHCVAGLVLLVEIFYKRYIARKLLRSKAVLAFLKAANDRAGAFHLQRRPAVTLVSDGYSKAARRWRGAVQRAMAKTKDAKTGGPGMYQSWSTARRQSLYIEDL